ncbi:MAG: hypothetical protein ACOX60_08515 [Massiliimalia sp.]|jgi:hypothetical protein
MSCQHHHKICSDMSYHDESREQDCSCEKAPDPILEQPHSHCCHHKDDFEEDHHYCQPDRLRTPFWPEFSHPRWLAAEDLYPCLKEEN